MWFLSVARSALAILFASASKKELGGYQVLRNQKNHENRRCEALRRLLERVAGETLALGPNIIAAQFAQRIGHKFGCDSLTPRHVKVRVVQGLGNASREFGGLFDGLLIQGAAKQRFCRFP